MIEKRTHPRHVVAGMGIHAKTLFNVEVEILDISMSGASIRSTKRLEIGSDEDRVRLKQFIETLPGKGSES